MKTAPDSNFLPLRVLHVSCDFPDPIVPFKTTVVRTLIDLTANYFDHQVLSLNRRSPRTLRFAAQLVKGLGRPQIELARQPFEYGEAIVYDAPAYGLYLASSLTSLGDQIADRLLAMGALPDILIGHKLSIEGIAVRQVARRLGKPYALSIQGDTDTKVLAARPDLRHIFAAVFHDAAMVFPFAPWALHQVEQRLGRRRGPVRMLPCPTDLDEPITPVSDGSGLISTFHLKNHRRKNLRGMVEAMKLLEKAGENASLAIVGGGDDAQVRACRDVIGDSSSIMLEGPLDRKRLRTRLSRATAFICPSLRESFGLVFIEALFAGLPVIYPRGTAIHGYFEDLPFVIAVDARDTYSIAQGMRQAIDEETRLKSELASWQRGEEAAQFRRPAIAMRFAEGLFEAASYKSGAFGANVTQETYQ